MPDLVMHTVNVLHQRKYVHTYKFEPISPSTWRWMGNSLEALAQRSELTPVVNSKAIALDRGIHLAQSIRAWRSVVAKPLAQLKASDVLTAFQALEQSLEESAFSNYISVLVGRTFRNFVTNHIAAAGQPVLAKRIQSSFSSNLMRPSKSGRALISDLPKPGRVPVGAVVFGSHAELKEATLTTLRDDLADILRCCEDVLDRYDLALAFLNNLEHLNIPSAEVERIRGKSTRQIRNGVRERNWSTEDLEMYLSLVKTGKIAPTADRRNMGVRKLRYHPLGAKELLVAGLHGMTNGAHIKELMRLDIAPPSDVLLACALILQIHTHWNFISVLELKASDVLVTKFPHRLQSVKPRTSDETPVVFVERSDELVIRAMAHVRHRWERLVAAGIIGNDDDDLWISAWFLRGGQVQSMVCWAKELREFTEAHKLPSFSLEQVRVQCLALVATTRRGLGGAMQSAGHIAGSTTLRYIDKSLLRRLNSANLLEFERRLESTILYEMGRPATGRRLSNLSLGDGAQCADPLRPPNPAWMRAGICAGEMCHQGDGCPHRRVIIDRARLEEVIRSKSYYVSNWKRLADENSVRFERVHVPQILFSLALYGVVKKGPYRHLVATFEK